MARSEHGNQRMNIGLAENVTQTGNVVKNIYVNAVPTCLSPGPLRWTSRRYPFGRFLKRNGPSIVVFGVSGMLLVLSVLFLSTTTSWLPDLGLPIIRPLLQVFVWLVQSMLILYFGIGLAMRLLDAVKGFSHSGPRSGYLKECDGSIASVVLGGPGVICPYEPCGGQLEFSRGYPTTLLQCDRNLNHCWNFDHGLVGD